MTERSLDEALFALDSMGWGVLTAEQRIVVAQAGVTPTRAGVSQRTLDSWVKRAEVASHQPEPPADRSWVTTEMVRYPPSRLRLWIDRVTRRHRT